MPRPRPIDFAALAAASTGASLAVQAWLAGSLFRYQLAGFVVGAVACLPLVLILAFGERARRALRKLAFAAVPLLGALLLAELAYRTFGPAPLPPEVLRADPRLGHVLEPGSGGMDARGFRNKEAVSATDVLVVGDSQTWGFQVAGAETFAARLAAELGTRTYQMANGAYGSVQYRELVRQGLALRPRTVVVALYFGNDLLDATTYAGLDGAADLRAADRTYPAPRNPELDGLAAPNWTMALVDHLLGASRVLGAAAAAAKARLRGGVLDHQPGALPFTDGDLATILLPAYRLPTVDPGNAAVIDGLRITSQCLGDIAADCRAAGARPVLLLIPTKEAAFAEWRTAAGAPLAELTTLLAAENAARATVTTAAAGFTVVDLRPSCVSALGQRTNPWPPTGDGHLNALGHALAARALAAVLR